MLNTDDLWHHTEVGTGYSKDAQLARAADEIDALRAKAARWEAIETLMIIGDVELKQADDGGYNIYVDPVENYLAQSWDGSTPDLVADKVAAQLTPAAVAKVGAGGTAPCGRTEALKQQRDELLQALRSCSTDEGPDHKELDHARGLIAKVGAGETAPCGRTEALKQMIARLVDVMERSDAEQFGAEVETVTGDEWFATIRAAKEMLG
jgi:hypothetical protein